MESSYNHQVQSSGLCYRGSVLSMLKYSHQFHSSEGFETISAVLLLVEIQKDYISTFPGIQALSKIISGLCFTRVAIPGCNTKCPDEKLCTKICYINLLMIQLVCVMVYCGCTA